jgi:pimeloyl-ACP methyl ester carboxylesterase
VGYLLAAKYPKYVKKLIMVGSGLFDSKYAKNIMETRLNRMSKDEQNQYNELMTKLKEIPNDSDELFHQMGKLMEKVDFYDPIKVNNSHIVKGQYQIYKNVWPQAAKMRETGELLNIGKSIKCPVIAIHGDYDSHPYQGVKKPLSIMLDNFSFILLDKCGHEPWIERQAKDQFMSLIEIHLQDIERI